MSTQPALRTDRFDRRLGEPGFAWTGRLERIYAHTAVASSGGDQADLLLQHPDRDLLPRGIQVPWDRLGLRPGERLWLADGRLKLSGGPGPEREIGLVGGGVDLHLGVPRPGCRTALLHQLAGSGLPERIRQVLGDTPCEVDLAGQALAMFSAHLTELAAALGVPGSGEAKRVLVLRLIGLGIGSTPAGDDALVGMLAAAQRFGDLGWLDGGGLDSVRAAIAEMPAGATTPAGRAMLEQAAGGCYPLALVNLVRNLGCPACERSGWTTACDRLLRLGETSGQDMLAGVLATARAVVSERR